jgi:hypothetical protein
VKQTIALIGVILLSFGIVGFSSTPTVPEDQWTRETRLVLARALVGEVGFILDDKDEMEQAAVAYVFLSRYETRSRLQEGETFVKTIRAYSTAVRPSRRPTRRQRWVRALPAPTLWLRGGIEEAISSLPPPRGWNKKARWSNFQDKWVRTYLMVQQWYEGKVENPCPGARHFGGDMDPRRGAMKKMVCKYRFGNTFYR